MSAETTAADEVFRCDHCGQLTPLNHGTILWEPGDRLSDGRQLHYPGVYCSQYCGRSAGSSSAGSNRG